MLKGNSLDIIFLSETKTSVERMKVCVLCVLLICIILKAIKFADMCVVEAKGIVGGICVMWKSGLSIHQMEYNKNLIALKVTDALCDWLLVCFYGPPYLAKKQKAWENFMALLNSCQHPWVCIGDFNFTINDKEIFGGNKRGESSATNFLKELIFEFDAIDLDFFGNTFTWAKGK